MLRIFHYEGFLSGYAELTSICELEERVEDGDADEAHNHQSQIQQGQPPKGGEEGLNIPSILIQLLNNIVTLSISLLVTRQCFTGMTCSAALHNDPRMACMALYRAARCALRHAIPVWIARQSWWQKPQQRRRQGH